MMPSKNKGMTLVEVILAMAILAIIVVFMTPVLVSAFRQIVINGNRSIISKSINGDIQGALAGGTVPGSLGTDAIQLPSGETVLINKYEVMATDSLGNIKFNFFIPQGMTMATSPTAPTASTPTGSLPSESTGPFVTDPPPVAQFNFSTQTIAVNVDAWRSTNRVGTVTLINSSSWFNNLEYILTDKTTNSVSSSDTLSSATTNISLPDNTHSYVLSIQNRDDPSNRLTVNIGKAPVIAKIVSGSKYTVSRYCSIHSINEKIVGDMHHPEDVDSTSKFNYYYWYNGKPAWNQLDQSSSSVKFDNNSSTLPFYVHIHNTNTISALGVMDTNSLPAILQN